MINKSDDSMEKLSSGNVRSIDRALSILDCFSEDQGSYSLTELAKKINLSLTTTLRILGTLENRNYISRDPDDGKYYLGHSLARIGNIAMNNMDISRISTPFLHDLCARFNESFGIYARKNDHRVCVARINGTNSLRYVINIGTILPLTRGASGRTILAYMPEKDILRLLEKDPYTNMEELAQLRELGYAHSQSERDAALESFSAPIFNAEGEVIAAVFMSGPVGRITKEKADQEIIPAIKNAAREISINMGYRF